MVEALFVANDFDCDILICFMIQCANHLTKTSLSNHLQNLITVTNVIVDNLQNIKKNNFIKIFIVLVKQFDVLSVCPLNFFLLRKRQTER